MEKKFVLVINPGSTSTKISVFEKEDLIKTTTINHPLEEIKGFENIPSQLNYRLELIYNWLKEENIDKDLLIAVVGRGGMLRSIPCGV